MASAFARDAQRAGNLCQRQLFRGIGHQPVLDDVALACVELRHRVGQRAAHATMELPRKQLLLLVVGSRHAIQQPPGIHLGVQRHIATVEPLHHAAHPLERDAEALGQLELGSFADAELIGYPHALTPQLEEDLRAHRSVATADGAVRLDHVRQHLGAHPVAGVRAKAHAAFGLKLGQRLHDADVALGH